MRLPQSSIRSLVVYTIHFLTISFAISVVISLVCSTPAEAKAPTPQLVGSPNNLQFGAVVLGQTQTLLVPVTNTGQASVTISGVTVRNPEFSVSNVNLPLVLAAGQSVDVNVNFTPTVMGWRGGTVTFASNATNANFTIEVAGSGTNGYSITASPAAISFGQVAMGGSSTIPVVLSNLDSWRVNVSSIQVSGSEFAISGAAFPMTIGGGQSVTVNVVFTPTSAGMVGGSLFVVGPKALTIPLTGMGAAVGQLTVAPASMNFGSIPDGTTGTQTISLSAVGSSVTVSSGSSSSAQFVLSGASFPLTIPAGQSASFHVAFTPQNTGMASGALSFASNASAGSASVNIPLTGAGTAVTGQLTVTPASVNFGSIPDGTTGTQSISLSASGASVTVSSGSSNSSQFVLSGGSFPMTIPAGQSASFKVTFTPQTSGSASGSLSFASNASTTPTVSLAGAGTAVIGQLTVSPASLNFGSVVDGTTQSQPITLSATGASVTISSDSSSSSQFVLSGASFPMTIPAGQTASFKVVFTPQSTGSISGALSFASNASTAPSVTFAGSGTAATGQLSITPASLNFGSVVDGTTQSQPITL
ncbi:MAG: choice-of-anchor D domain-containing protein, partial [Candidatus Sulfotelmatobacter sp.]